MVSTCPLGFRDVEGVCHFRWALQLGLGMKLSPEFETQLHCFLFVGLGLDFEPQVSLSVEIGTVTLPLQEYCKKIRENS